MDLDFTLETITPDASTILTIGGDGALQLPAGGVGSRPAGVLAGALRWNTSTPQIEYYGGSSWSAFVTSVTGSAGVIASSSTGSITLSTPITSTGDLIIGTGTNTAGRLAIGTTGQFLSVVGGTVSWTSIGTAAYSVNVGPSGTIAWSLVSGNIYNAVITHNLGTQNVVVQMADISNNQVVQPDLITINSATQITIQVAGTTVNSKTLRVVVIANGASIAAGTSTPSSVIVQNNGVALTGTYTTLNLTGVLSATGASNVATISSASLTGDGTTSGAALTLATVNSNVGSFGTTTAIPVITVNAKGLVTAVSTVTPSITVQSNGIPVTGSPFTTINFAGATLIATNSGNTITITDTVTAIRTLTYFASSLDSPNNADWVINALAPTVADPTNSGITVRQFSNTVEQGVGLSVPIPSNATNIIFTYKGRSASATAGTLQMRLYSRVLAAVIPAAIGTWSAATNLTSVSSPANVFFQTFTQTSTLASLSLIAGNLYQFEFTRNIGVAGNLAFNWLMVELDIAFT